MGVSRYFRVEGPRRRGLTAGDLLVLTGVAGVLYIGLRLAFNAPEEVSGPTISLQPSALPWYAFLSIGRMIAAYALSLVFSLIYGRVAANSRVAERVMLPLLDVLQSVPILSFLPVVLLGLSAVLPTAWAAELASVVLIFTSQVWNMTFAWYQSLTTLPGELQEASSIFRLNSWLRFRFLELPFAAIPLAWNSLMSWAGGWFFLMAAEMFTVGQRDFRLAGLGAYLQEAANQNDLSAILFGLGALVLVIVILDQFVWRPLLNWTNRFKLGMAQTEEENRSWFLQFMRGSNLFAWLKSLWLAGPENAIDRWMEGRAEESSKRTEVVRKSLGWRLLKFGMVVFFAILTYFMTASLIAVPFEDWRLILIGLGATLLRVSVALVLALLWTVPVGVAIATNRRLSAFFQPLAQIMASVPSTALFPVFVLFIIGMPGGLNLAAVLLMLTGSQWYLLFNVIAGANAIPEDLRYTATLLNLSRSERWRTLILPALFPYLVTGAITASGGAWNASIVAEYIEFGGETLSTTGIGSIIAQATADGHYPQLIAATMAMVVSVVLINRIFWRRLYTASEEIYRME